MGQYHTVIQGEYLSQIARKYGFASYETIWEAGENAKLKQERKNPNVLFPGDQLFIPDKELREETRSTETKNIFVIKTDPLKLRLRLEGFKKEPLSGHECTLTVETDSEQFTTGGDGVLEKEIPVTAAQGLLLDRGKNEPKRFRTEIKLPLKIGHLDPEKTLTGQIARLNNLGYNAGLIPDHPLKPEEEKTIRESEQFLSAVEEFQCDFGLKVDGICGPNTQAKLLDAHGS